MFPHKSTGSTRSRPLLATPACNRAGTAVEDTSSIRLLTHDDDNVDTTVPPQHSRGGRQTHDNTEEVRQTVNDSIDQRQSDRRYDTSDSNVAQFLVFRGRRCQCTLDGNRVPVFSFVDSRDVRADVSDYVSGAAVIAVLYAGAGRLIRKQLNEARGRASGTGAR